MVVSTVNQEQGWLNLSNIARIQTEKSRPGFFRVYSKQERPNYLQCELDYTTNKMLALLLVIMSPLSLEACEPSETQATGSSVAQTRWCAGDLVFEEPFDEFDLEKWEHEITLSGGGNWEFQYYTNNRSNSFVADGHLHIRPTLLADDFGETFLHSDTLDVNGALPVDQCTDASFYGCVRTGTPTYYINPIKSAKIKSSGSFSFRYGKIVVRAKMPQGDWLWPAVWMMPRYNSYGKWPASGEIDLIEARGNKNYFNLDGVNIGTQQVGSTLHWGPFTQLNRWPKTHFERNDPAGYDADFHEYEMRWTSDNLTFFIDGVEMGRISPPDGGFWKWGEFEANLDNPWKGGGRMAPFDQKFYIIVNLAVGGTSFFRDDNGNLRGKPWKNNSTTAYRDFWQGKDQWLPTWNFQSNDTHLIIDYIRVYAV